MRRIFTGTAVALALACAACTRPVPPGVRAGERFPQLVVARVEAAGEIALPGEADGLLVVNVWATWCEPCRREMPSLEKLHRRLAASGGRVVGISVDGDRHLAAEFARARGLTFENGSAAAHDLSAGPLAVSRFPTTFVVDARGVVRWREEAPRDWSDAATLAKMAALAQGGS